MARCLECGRRFAGRHACGDGRVIDAPTAAVDAAPVSPPAIEGYAVERVLGRGGAGVVWAARRRGDGRAVAIKIGLQRHDRALMAEGEALATIGPPTVPELIARGLLPGGEPYVVMELLAWPTLAERLTAASGPLPLGDVAALAGAVLAAVGACHRRGVVHRDLKPENLFVGGAPLAARLVDFGLGQRAGSAAPPPAGVIAGSAYYMAPEQCESGRLQDERTDVYACGVMLYEMLTGRVPFFGASEAELRQCHQARRPPAPSSFVPVPAAVEAVVLRCLAKDPARRFGDVAALQAALTEALAQPAQEATRQPAAAATRQPAAATREPAAAATREPAADAAGRQRRALPLLFLDSDVPLGRLQSEVRALGGQLASVATPRYVVAFAEDRGEPPLRRAVRAARSLTARGLCPRVLVELATVSVQARPDGSARIASPLFRSERHFQLDDGPAGVRVSPAVAETMPELAALPPVGEAGWRPLPPHDRAADATVLRDAASAMIGRDQILAALVAAAEAAVREPAPSITTIVGEAGHGKSHLCAALAAELRRRVPGAQHLEVRAPEPMSGDPDEALRALLRGALALPADAGADEARAQLGRWCGAAAVAELWPAIALTLGFIEAGDASVARLTAVPGLLRSARARAAGEVLRRVAAARPLFVVVDDAHFADQTTLDALEHATLADARAAVFVLAFARPDLLAQRPLWGERAAAHVAHRLDPLDDAAAMQLCRQLLKPVECVADEAVRRLVERARGVPLLLTELVRGLKRDGAVKRDAKSGAWYLASDELGQASSLPVVAWLAERELQQLPAALAASARLTSLLASDFSIAELEGVVGELDRGGAGAAFPLDAHVAAERLVAAGVLTAHRTHRLSFRHAVVREAMADAVPAAQRQAVHAAAYRYYRTAALRDELRLPRLAHHAARSGMAAEAARLYLELAARADERHAYVEGEALLTAALAQLGGDDAPARLGALAGRGRMRFRVSRFGDALADLGEAQRLARALDDRRVLVELLLDEAMVLDWTDEFARASATVEEARARLPDDGGGLVQARLFMGEGRSHWRSGRWQAAKERLSSAIAAAERLGAAGYETLVESLLMLGEILTYGGELGAAERAYDRVIELSRERHDLTHWAGALNNRRCVWIARKQGDRAVADLVRCMELSRECGLMTLESYAQFNTAELLYLLDRDEAAGEIEKAIEMHRRRIGQWCRPVGRLLKARFLAARGDEAAAAALLADIEAAQAEAREAGHAEALFLESEAILCAAIAYGVRDAGDAEWDVLVARSARHSVEQERIEVLELRALAAARRGRRAEAARWLDEAEAVARTLPNIMDARLARRRAQL